ncbi:MULTISPECIES: GNAT family N-acetyltransferase [Bhargavaea]|uniref:GNAT family N-acetyltransferase n=1 Tax=Bhargavaea changchunensis TaxID=2134037 RepID=A0ABW2NKZ5_9BACL|nr:GNAT family protein [Bhargavaea sp. CC-171006]
MSKPLLFPDLGSERLFLRNVSEEDTEFLYEHFSDDKVCEYLYDEENFTSREEAAELVDFYSDPENAGYNRWVLVKKETGERIGTCGFHLWDRTNHIAEIGYDLSPEFWGRGYMKEALTAAIGSGFDNMKLNRINAYVAVENQRSWKLLLGLNFKNEGIYRDKHLYRGKYYDHYSLSLLKREWN